MIIHLARWLITPDRPPTENAGVVTFGGKIIAAGKRAEIRRDFHGKTIDYGDAIICPPLVNAHCHMELSNLAWKLEPGEVRGNGAFIRWVRQLIALRELLQKTSENAIEHAMYQMIDNGIAVIGDVGNSSDLPDFVHQNQELWPFAGIFFQEIISPLERLAPDLPPSEKTLISHEASLPFFRAFSAHAPYTVSPSAIREIDCWNRASGLPFCIHAAESEDETEFLQQGTGAIVELMKEKGHWPLDWKIPGASAISYLKSLGCLHSRTLLIHCVQADAKDLDLVADSRASVCLCPLSNRFIGVGTAPAHEMYKRGINIALGTDSLASNRQLSIFSEMAQLAKDAPGLSAEAIFRAATAGGAEALGFEDMYGRIQAGMPAIMMVVRGECQTGDAAMEFLVNQAQDESVNISLVES